MSGLPPGLMSTERSKTIFVGFNKNTNMLRWNKGKKETQDLGGVAGTLLGFSSDTYIYEGQDVEKFNIWLEKDGSKIEVSFGMESFIALGVMNTLLSIPRENDKIGDGTLSIVCFPGKNDKAAIFMNWNRDKLRWKYEWAALKIPSELTAKEKEGKTEKTQKEMLRLKRNERKGIIIKKWFEELMALKPYDSNNSSDYVDEETGEMNPPDDDDEVPF